jgi:HSP20 family molecular chaperone IbpA
MTDLRLQAAFERAPQAIDFSGEPIVSIKGKEGKYEVFSLAKLDGERKNDLNINFAKDVYFLNIEQTEEKKYTLAGRVNDNLFFWVPLYRNCDESGKLFAIHQQALTTAALKEIKKKTAREGIEQTWTGIKPEHVAYTDKDFQMPLVQEDLQEGAEEKKHEAGQGDGAGNQGWGGSCSNSRLMVGGGRRRSMRLAGRHSGAGGRRRSSFGGLFSGYRRMSRMSRM